MSYPIMSSSRAVSTGGGSDVTDSSIDHIIHELLSQAEVEVQHSVRNIEEARFPRPPQLEEQLQGPPPATAPEGEEEEEEDTGTNVCGGIRSREEDRRKRERLAPSPSVQKPDDEDILPPVQGEHSFTPSFAQESSVWYEAQEYDHRSDLDLDDAQSQRSGAEMSDATYASESESELSLKSSSTAQRRGYHGHGRHSGRYGGAGSGAAIKSLQNRLLQVMRKESKLQIKAEMARTEVEVLKGKLNQSQDKTKRLEKNCKHLEGKIKQLKAQDTYVQCKKLQSSLAKSTELNSKLVHKFQTLKLELRKEKARRHHAESTAKMSFSGRHVPLDVMDSMVMRQFHSC